MTEKKTEKTKVPRGTVAVEDLGGPEGGTALARAARESAEDQGLVEKPKSDYVEQKKARMASKKNKTDKLDLSGKSVEELTELFNEMVPTAIDLGIKHYDVRKEIFMTQQMGKNAIDRLHFVIQKTRHDKDNPPATKRAKEKTVKKATKKTAKSTSKKTSKRLSLDENAKITWRGKENPFREGSGRYKRTEIVRASSGKTVKTYLSNKGKVGTLSYCVRSGLASVA